MSQDKILSVLTANHADRTRKATVSLIVSGCFALRGWGFLRQYIAFAGSEKEICLDAVLFGVEVIVAATQGVQGFVRPAFDDAPGLDDEDLIRTPDGGQAMGDDERCAATHQIAQPLLNKRFRFRIKARSSFVEDENPWIGKNGPGNRDPLLLAAGKLHAPLANDGVALFLERFRQPVDSSHTASSKHFLLGCFVMP